MSFSLSFSSFCLLKEETRTATKSLLYPFSYGGIGNYPPSYFIPQAADAILYISKDERMWCNGDGPPWDISHIPGHKQFGDKINNGEGKPWDIHKVPGKTSDPEDHRLPGKEIPYKGFVRLVNAIKCISPKGVNLPSE